MVRGGSAGNDGERAPVLLEREAEIQVMLTALEASAISGSRTLLVEGPPGIGKTSLLRELERLAAERDFRVLTARGSEMERDFGFGVVRQLLGRTVEELDPGERARIFSGSAALGAPVFGADGGAALEAANGEASLYGLYWLVTALAEQGPVALLIDDAHWADTASLRFAHYLGQRLEDAPVLIVLSARPSEPGAQAEVLGRVVAELEPAAVRPATLSPEATGEIVRARLDGSASAAIEAACHEATGGNPLLIEELLADLPPDWSRVEPDQIAAMGPSRIARSVADRALRLGDDANELVRAVAVLGDGPGLGTAAELAAMPADRAAAVADDLAAAGILGTSVPPRFAHPLLRSAVHDGIPDAARAAAHARAAALLRELRADPEEIAAHLVLTEPPTDSEMLELLEEAARNALRRGAPDSAIAYLGRALAEARDASSRSRALRLLGTAEIAQRNPAAIGHLQEAAELTESPADAIGITLQLADVLAMTGNWDASVAAIDGALARYGDGDHPGTLHLEAYRAAHRAYDPAGVGEFEADLPRLNGLVEGRRDAESRHLRWLLGGAGAVRQAPAEEVVALIVPPGGWSTEQLEGWESPMITQAALALLIVDALDEAGVLEPKMREFAQSRGSLMSMVAGRGYAAALATREGRVDAAEADIRLALEAIEENRVGLVALTTFLSYCIDAILERPALDDVAAILVGIEIPDAFARTLNGGLLLEVKAAIKLNGDDREGGIRDLRHAEGIFRGLGIGPRGSSWRSRLALALPESLQAEAVLLADEELALARECGSARAEGVALRTRGLREGGEQGIATLKESVAVLAEVPSGLESARSLAALGGALRRGNHREEARGRLGEALALAQQLGAQRLEERIFEELRVAGAKPRRREVSGVGALTPAELRVANAAATGTTNREIAQSLFVSLRTVEMHLTNAYRKLGIASRGELAAAIRG